MNKITPVSQYKKEDLEKAKQLSPALARYLNLIDQSPSCPKDQLTLLRHKYWIECTLATLFTKATAEEICSYWSQRSFELIKKAWELTGSEEDLAPQSQLALFAFGKLGSEELNLSSDVDLLFICEKDPHLYEGFLKRFQFILNHLNEFGFIFRVDFDLRPGGRMGPLIPSKDQFIDYYSNYGETWERISLLRMNFICGDKSIAKDITQFNEKFCYRKHLDFSLLENIHHLRSQIHNHYYEKDPCRIDLKTAPGGIRDIELFTHALLIIHGGKNPQIREKQTSYALKKLSDGEFIEKSIFSFLSDSYWQLRQWENLVQSENDQQTHVLTQNFCEKFNIYFSQVTELMNQVSHTVEAVTGPIYQTTIPTSSDEQNTWLQEIGFDETTIKHHWQRLQESQKRFLSKQGQKKEQNHFLKKFIEETVAINLNKNLALANLADFIESTQAKNSLFSLFNRHPQLIKDLAYLFSLSPYLSRIICQRPDLMDSFLFRSHKEFSQELDVLLDELVERKLVTELVSGFHFLGNKNLEKLFSSLSSCADEIVKQLLASLKKEYGESELKVLCLGKWGGQELGLKADLDFILITPNTPEEIDHKIAKRLVSRLTENQRGGIIYDIDLRLSPYGANSALLTSEESLKHFLENSAETWQRQAYLRARPLNGPLSFNLQETILNHPINEQDIKELISIRKQLLRKNSKDQIDLKMSPGGLIDCEFHIQIAILKHQISFNLSSSESMLEALCQKSGKWQNARKELLENYFFLRAAGQLHRLSTQQPSSLLSIKSESFQQLASLFHSNKTDFHQRILTVLERNQTILNDLDPLA